MTNKTRAPRRRIERIGTQLVQFSVPTAGTTVNLHIAEDAKTLIRTLLDINLGYLVSNVNDRYDTVDLLLAVRPSGQQVAGSTLSASVDRVVAIQEIARWTVGVRCWKDIPATGGSASQIGQQTRNIHADISAMRKLKETDNISLSVIAGTNDNEVKIDGNIYMWFKE